MVYTARKIVYLVDKLPNKTDLTWWGGGGGAPEQVQEGLVTG